MDEPGKPLRSIVGAMACPRPGGGACGNRAVVESPTESVMLSAAKHLRAPWTDAERSEA